MTAPAQHLLTLTGLTRRQVARLVGCSERTFSGYTHGATPTDPHRSRIDQLTAIIEPLGTTGEERRRALLASSRGLSLLHRLVAEVPRGQVIQVAIPVRERLGV